jgi:hypothetical protein
MKDNQFLQGSNHPFSPKLFNILDECQIHRLCGNCLERFAKQESFVVIHALPPSGERNTQRDTGGLIFRSAPQSLQGFQIGDVCADIAAIQALDSICDLFHFDQRL